MAPSGPPAAFSLRLDACHDVVCGQLSSVTTSNACLISPTAPNACVLAIQSVQCVRGPCICPVAASASDAFDVVDVLRDALDVADASADAFDVVAASGDAMDVMAAP